MLNLMQFIRPLLPVTVVLLLCVTNVSTAEANNGASSASAQKTTTIAPVAADQQDNKQPKAVPQKPSQKSVLDADMLERPLSFFKNSFSPEEEDDDNDAMFSHSTTIVIAVKALIASLLSTII